MATTQKNGDMADPASNKIEAVSDAQMKSEPDDVEPAYTESVGSVIADQLPVSTEMVYSHTDGSELVASQPMDSTSVHPVPVYTVTLPDSPNAGVNREPAEVEATAIEEQVSIAYVDQHQFLSEAVISEQFHGEAEPMSADMHDQQPSVSVMDYPQSELVYSQPDGSEAFDHDVPSSVYNGETLHQKSDFIKMEHALPELMRINGSDIVQSPGPEVEHVTALGSTAVQTRPSRSRKKKSEVWNHFEIETVSPDCRRARCKVCLQSFAYSTGSKVSGTSHLKRHVAKGSCPQSFRQQTANQSTPLLLKSAEAKPGTTGTAGSRKRRCRSSSTPYLVFDQDRCRLDIARMIIMHEYPLHMVEHPGLLSFVQHLQPRFNMVNVNTVQGDCVTTYLREKQSLQKLIDGMHGRLCLTLDVWTSNQTTGYVFLHGQFIDQEWKLQRRLLNVVMEPFPESDTALSHAVVTCLAYWNLNSKLHSITFNQPVSDAARANLRGLLSIKNASILSGQLLIRSCFACTLSGMAIDVLAAGQGAVRKIRSSVKYVKTSDAREDKFLKLKQQLQVPSEKALVLDNVTRWDSTYHMLAAACKSKEVFSCLDALDTEYTDAPTANDWKQAEIVGSYLKLLFETASLLVARIPPSTEAFFHEVWKIQLELARDAASADPFVSSIVVSLQERFGKYWKDSCVVLAIAVAMDPRFKMKLVEFSFLKLFGEEAQAYIRMVNEGIHGLFNEYAEDRRQENQPRSLVSSTDLSDFDKYIMETTSQQEKSELDQYLDESLLPRVQDFDILGWWKLNELKYPALTRMALDVLSVPLSSVGSDHVFGTVGREMGEHRSSLRPETLEALMCAKDWLWYEGPEPEAMDGQVKTEAEAGSNKPLSR